MKNDQINNVEVFGLEDSIRGAKFPMATDLDFVTEELTPGIKKLAMSPKGEGHDNWLNGVIVQFDLTATNKFWVEMERYHFIDFVSSQSTMHRITQFDLNEVYNEYVDPRIINIMKEKQEKYKDESLSEKEHKQLYYELLYSNPAGFTLTARMTTNYRQLKTIYAQRLNHRLKEWRDFCAWIETLPESYLITGKELNDVQETL